MIDDAAGLRGWLFGSLHLSGARHDDLPRRVRRALGWYRALQGRGAALTAPFSWVYDLGHLLVLGDAFPFRSPWELAGWPDDERGPRLDYENRLLNALLRDPSVRQASEALRQDATRDDLIARGIELLLAPLADAPGLEAPAVDMGLLRELRPWGALDPAAEAAAWEARAGRPGALLAAHAAATAAWLARRRPGPLLGADDLAEVEHWSAYRRAAQRLAGRRIAARAAAYPALALQPLDASEEREEETDEPDSGYYPQGGFSELATRGALENLLPTELLFLGEDPFGQRARPDIDLFTLRTLEAETLYFQRDSGQLKRTRRTVHMAIAPDAGLRVQLRWHGDPLAVLVYGLALRLIDDLGRVFRGDAARVEVHLVETPGAPRDRLEEDAELLRVLLRHEVARGACAVHVSPAALDLRALGARDRRVFGVAVAAGERDPAGLPAPAAGEPESGDAKSGARDAPAPRPASSDRVRPPRITVLRLGGAREDATSPAGPVVDALRVPVEGDPMLALAAARVRLLARITGAVREVPRAG